MSYQVCPYTLGISLLSFMVRECICHHPCLYADVAKPLVEVSCPCLYFHHAWGPYVGRALHSFYFGLPYVGVQLPALLCAFIGFLCVSAAYMAEIFVHP